MLKTSIIIPVKEINNYLRQETIPALLEQTEKDFEIIIVTDKPSPEVFPKTVILPSYPKTGPADKRDLGAKKAGGEILAFLDDDSYPQKDWLEKALLNFSQNSKISGVGGPTLTPPNDNLYRKASGYVWSTWLGSGGAGTYRCAISSRRGIDDYPTVNFLVRKKDFWKVGGFDSHFWPGEDTKLCHSLIYELKKEIVYDPQVIVFHHRRPVLRAHLEQIARYAIHRGHFAKILPKTSLRLGYLLPSFFVLGLFFGLILVIIFRSFWLMAFYFLLSTFYFFLLFLTGFSIFLKEKNLKLAGLSMFSIVVTHFVYGILFIKGFFSQKLIR